MRKTLTALGTAVLVLGLGVALAHAASARTNLNVLGYVLNSDDSDDVFTGNLNSPNRRCLPNRRVRMYKETGSGFKLVDTDRSSRHGAWATRGNLHGQPDLKFTVARRTYGNLLCRRDATRFP